MNPEYEAFSFSSQTNMFIVSLALSDLLMMSSMGIPVFINAFSAPYWMWGPKICRIYGAGGAIFGK